VKPYQKPHPPIVGTASDPDSKGLIALGRRGLGTGVVEPAARQLLCRTTGPITPRALPKAATSADREIWRVARSIFVSEDSGAAKSYGGDDPNSPYRFYMRQLMMKLARGKKLGAFKAVPTCGTKR
jgi:hypothetical protein